MPSSHFRVGLIVPSSNTVMESDFHRLLGAGCAISTSRVYLEQVTRDAEQAMIDDDLPKALRLIKTTDPHLIVFGCTSAGSSTRDARIRASWMPVLHKSSASR